MKKPTIARIDVIRMAIRFLVLWEKTPRWQVSFPSDKII